MDAVILAAGKGTRMMPLTEDMPKPMIKIEGKPILEHTLNAVYSFVDNIIIIIGYKGLAIKKHFGNSFKGVKIIYAEQKEQLGTGHALLCSEKIAGEKILIVPGDDFIAKDVIRKAIRHERCIVAFESEYPERFGVLEVNKDYAVGLEEKPEKPKSNLVSTGIMVMGRSIFTEMKKQKKSKRGEFELTDALKEILTKEKVYCEVIEEGWIPIGYPEDLRKAEAFLNRTKKKI